MSDLWVHLPTVADELTFIRSMHTEPINHDPAVTLMQTGRPESGLPCVGSWCSYGLGADNRDLPAFIFMMSGTLDQPITTRYFTNGFLPAQHQGVQFFPASDPVQYLQQPARPVTQEARRRHRRRHQRPQPHPPRPGSAIHGDRGPASIPSNSLAAMQTSAAPELVNVADESERTLSLYGPDVRNPGTFARQCLLARRLVERGVRFVQLFHRGWDAHTAVIGGLRRQVRDVDQPIAALIRDLKTRGLLDSTLVVWGGEFGRTAYGQGDLSGAFGRDHHPRCFTTWLAGGGIKPGVVLGSTDDFGYNLAERPVHVNDLHATILHCLGIDHLRLTYRHGGRDFRLTDLAGEVVPEVLA